MVESYTYIHVRYFLITMRKLLIPLFVLTLAGFSSIPPAQAASGNLPRYSSISEASANAFAVSYKNLNKVEYVKCSLPAPITCGSPSATTQDLWGGVGGRAYRNEMGTLQVVVTDKGLGSLIFTAYTTTKGAWVEAGTWSLVGGVSRVLVANDGLHFAALALDGSVYSYELDSQKVTLAQVTPAGSSVTLSSTGKYLAWYKAATLSGATGQRCYVLADLTTGKTLQDCDSVKYWDLVTEDNRIFAFSPDDKTFIFRSDRDGYQKPYKVDLTKGFPKSLKPEVLFSKPYQMADMVFVANNQLAIVANRTAPTNWGLWNLNISKGSIASISDGLSYGVPIRRFGGYISFAKTTSRGVVMNLYNVKSETVTSVDTLANSSIATGDSIAAPVKTVAYAKGGGYALFEPSKVSKTTPIIIWMHGGPYRQMSTAGYHPFSSYGSFDWILDQVRQSGAIVAKLDYPGSYGYGRSFSDSLTGNVGVTDVSAVKTLVATLKTKYGTTAPIYLMGNSYGGYLADKSLVEMPSSFKGIYSISGVSGWEELLSENPNSIFSAQFKNATAGEQDPLFGKAEILLKTDKIGSQRILLAHGDSDNSVAVSQTKTLDQILQIAKKNVQTTIYPGEDHVFARPANFGDICRKAIDLVGGNSSGRCQL